MGDDRGTRVYVGNLGEKVKKEDLEGEFTKYGKLNSVWVAFNPPGFAFVEFENRNEAEKACDILNGTEVLGSKLRVEISKGRPKGRRDGGRGNPRFDGGNRRDSGGFGNNRSRDTFRAGGNSGGFGNSRGRDNFRAAGNGGPRSRGNFGSSGGGGYSSGGGGGGGGGGAGRTFGSRDGGRSFGRFRSRSPHGGRNFGSSGGGFNRKM